MNHTHISLLISLTVALAGCPTSEHDRSTNLGLDEHKKRYFALASHNRSANDDTSLAELKNFQWNIQLSLRRDLPSYSTGQRTTFAYTNRTFWQITGPSARIRTTDNELFHEIDFNDSDADGSNILWHGRAAGTASSSSLSGTRTTGKTR